MPDADDKTYLEHILECIEDISSHLDTAGGGRQAFMENMTVQAAVLRTLQIMAESTTRLTEVPKESMKEIPWPDIKGMRNILVHDYLGDIDLETVWETVEQDLPTLKSAVEKYYKAHYA